MKIIVVFIFLLALLIASCGSSSESLFITNMTNAPITILFEPAEDSEYLFGKPNKFDSLTSKFYYQTKLETNDCLDIGESVKGKDVEPIHLFVEHLIIISSDDTLEVKGRNFIKRLFIKRESEKGGCITRGLSIVIE